MDKYAITITRQFGSMGRPIAKRMAEILNINFYDRDIVEETAKQLELPISTVSDDEETIKTSLFDMTRPLGSGNDNIKNVIFETQAKIIQDIATRESCIIVGRCSDYVLKNFQNVINIYIYAPDDIRYNSCINLLMMKPSEARKKIDEVDKARRNYHKKYAGYYPEDISHKDILVDSSKLGIEGTAKYLVDYVRARFENV